MHGFGGAQAVQGDAAEVVHSEILKAGAESVQFKKRGADPIFPISETKEKTMTNWFKTLFAARAPVNPAPGDPFAHPDVARMSPRELADLPLVPPPAPAARRDRAVAFRPAPCASV
ncbi:hypothetical protein GCM10011360_34050 [Primorskyibacter flagellatus]|uniref:Uncharacterized protein n=1 Tax=Primorskyibacter flagellatus TaxID=1387277 RepID=A0A917AD40_9RHOB|nr:hypothetical protein GCM10011360_34050 [Primorskyibacter flagellatus]